MGTVPPPEAVPSVHPRYRVCPALLQLSIATGWWADWEAALTSNLDMSVMCFFVNMPKPHELYCASEKGVDITFFRFAQVFILFFLKQIW